jgi:hypothetical protein
MDWIESQINDESLFPVTTDIPFPKAATYIYSNDGKLNYKQIFIVNSVTDPVK